MGANRQNTIPFGEVILVNGTFILLPSENDFAFPVNVPLKINGEFKIKSGLKTGKIES